MAIRLTSCVAGLLLAFASVAVAGEPRPHSEEEAFHLRLQHMARSVELLREADQPELAAEVAARAETVERQLHAMEQQRVTQGRSRERFEYQSHEDAQRHVEVIQRLDELREQMHRLSDEVASLREQLDERRQREEEAKLGRVDLSGRWQMTLPAGFEYETQIKPRGDGLYQVDVRGNLRGVYRHRGKRLSIEIPADARLTEFVWELQNDDLLLLTASPASAKVGADYRGATLRRLADETTAEPAPQSPELQAIETTAQVQESL